ncbi:hypothetical protein PG995_014853 [Apiospora arundinis]
MVAAVLVFPATAGLDSVQTTMAPSTTSGPVEMSRECYNEVWENVFNDRKEPSGALRDVISSKDLFLSANMPTSECDLLSKIPASLHEEYFAFESQRSEWWKSDRSDFSKWASTCKGAFPTNNFDREVVTPYMTHSAFLDTYNPASATTCAGVTRGAAPSTSATSGAGAQETSTSEGGHPAGPWPQEGFWLLLPPGHMRLLWLFRSVSYMAGYERR